VCPPGVFLDNILEYTAAVRGHLPASWHSDEAALALATAGIVTVLGVGVVQSSVSVSTIVHNVSYDAIIRYITLAISVLGIGNEGLVVLDHRGGRHLAALGLAIKHTQDVVSLVPSSIVVGDALVDIGPSLLVFVPGGAKALLLEAGGLLDRMIVGLESGLGSDLGFVCASLGIVERFSAVV
jgi:hypothetical protein